MRVLIERVLFVVSLVIILGVGFNLSGCLDHIGCKQVDWESLGMGKRIVYDIPDNACDWGEVVRQNFKLIETRLNKCPCADPGIMFGRNPEDFKP